MHCYGHLLITILCFFLMIKRYTCLLLPRGRTYEFSISLFPNKNEQEETRKRIKRNKQISIVMHCSHVCILRAVRHTCYYSQLHDACVGQRVCKDSLLCALVTELAMRDQLRSYENNAEAVHRNKSLLFRFHNLEPVPMDSILCNEYPYI